MTDECRTLKPTLYQVYKQSYLGQFAVQSIETWQDISSTRNTPTPVKISVPMATNSFPVPSTSFQYVSDVQLEKHFMRLQTQANIFICLLDHAYEASFANMRMGCQRWPEMSLISVRSGTQYVAKVTKPLTQYCDARLVESYCEEFNIFFYHI